MPEERLILLDGVIYHPLVHTYICIHIDTNSDRHETFVKVGRKCAGEVQGNQNGEGRISAPEEFIEKVSFKVKCDQVIHFSVLDVRIYFYKYKFKSVKGHSYQYDLTI